LLLRASNLFKLAQIHDPAFLLEFKMQELVLIRGLPGSGKSTVAQRYYPNHVWVEADHYFVDPATGIYTYVPEEIREAHAYSQQKTRYSLEYKRNVVVSNTFTQIWELQPYLDIAALAKVKVEVVRCMGQWPSIHGVPPEKLQQMYARFEDYPGETLFKEPEKRYA
jgi:hypothetical protein